MKEKTKKVFCKKGLSVLFIFGCLFSIIYCQESSAAAESAPKLDYPVDVAFVNDGKIIVYDIKGNLIDSRIYGEDPYLSLDGTKVFYTKRVLTDRVYPDSHLFPRYGRTSKDDGICVWDLRTGKIEKICQDGSEPKLSPDGKSLAFVYNSKIYVKNLKSGFSNNVAKGEKHTWLGDNGLVYERDAQIIRLFFSGKKESLLVKPKGSSISSDSSEDIHEYMRTVLREILRGREKTFNGYYQSNLCSCDNGQKIAFCQQELSFDQKAFNACASIFVVDTRGKIQSNVIVKNIPNYPFNIITKMAISQDGSKAVFAQIVAELFQSLWDVRESDLFIAELESSSGEPRMLGRFPEAHELIFFDENTILIANLDKNKTLIPINGSNAMYVVGARSLAPDQLKMMHIDKAVATADKIYKIDLKTGKKTFFSSGHNIMVRPRKLNNGNKN